jgi:hypothetical protein
MKEIINHKDLNNTENLLCPTKQILGRVLNLITRVGEWRGQKTREVTHSAAVLKSTKTLLFLKPHHSQPTVASSPLTI